MPLSMEALHEVANEADRIARHFYGLRALDIQSKSDNSPVTAADLAIEKMIRDWVAGVDASIGVLGEEFGGNTACNSIRLIVDPIDGTRNFIRGIPFFATLLAVEINGEIRSGLVSSPVYKERWWGETSSGAFHQLNGNIQAMRVSTISELNEGQCFHGSLYGNEAKLTPRSLGRVLGATARQRGFGDYYLHMLVASGAGECGIDFGLKPWDKAPLKAIVEAAGGVVTNATGPFTIDDHSIVSTNGLVHPMVMALLEPNG